MISDRPVVGITEADLLQLIADGVMEGKRIEYKQSFDIQSDDQRRKLLASIASFANAGGGDLIFGVKACDGKACDLVPLSDFNSDEMKLRLTNMTRDGISPKLFGMEMREIPIRGGHCFIIRIPKAYAGAHMVTFNKDNRFYARAESGRVMMDMSEISDAIRMRDVLGERIRRWKNERLGSILADEIPFPFPSSRRIVLHIIPVAVVGSFKRVDLKKLRTLDHDFSPLVGESCRISPEFEGLVSHDANYEGIASGYTYVFENGCLEVVDINLINCLSSAGKEKTIPYNFDIRVIEKIPSYLRLLRDLECEPPFLVSLSMLNVKGMSIGSPSFGVFGHPFTYNNLVANEILLSEWPSHDVVPFLPLIDKIWMAAGRFRTINYDPEGNLVVR